MQTATTSSTAAPRQPAAYPWRMPKGWYLSNKRYFAYMLREVTAVFAALWVVLFLAQIPMMGAGPQNLPAHTAWVALVHDPWWVCFSFVAFILVGYHAWTWFNLMGTVMWMRFGKEPVPARLITSAMFLAWLGASVVIAFFIATPIVGG